ncbi:uncharacterized protein [Typha angustifolia]|uniref:uncharacterized protein n=1 Tax=Typha angustifolia TaxID=59011 RepID=UPI003C2E5810
MSGVSKLGVVLILVLVFLVLGFSLELIYVLYYRRRFRRAASSADSELASIPGDVSGGDAPSKELILYFLCLRNQSQVEPTSAASAPPAPPSKPSPPLPPPPPPPPESDEEEEEEVGVDLEKWRAKSGGPSRVLYTIDEDMESNSGGGGRNGIRSAGEADGPVPVEAVKAEEEEEEETPFSTPSPSPPFYTPTASPARDVGRI